ncbi:hypothetical protein OSTOST_25847 [Ostertagia ostertagi]
MIMEKLTSSEGASVVFQCLFEHYDVEERKRESVWKKMKGRLDQRVRNTRRPVGHTVARGNRNGSEEDEDAAAALERIRLADEDPQMVAITGRERNRGRSKPRR